MVKVKHVNSEKAKVLAFILGYIQGVLNRLKII